MLFKKKNVDDSKRDLRLNIWQLERLVTRALNNANNAKIAFDKSYLELFNSEDTLSKRVSFVTEFSNSRRYIKNNKQVLLEVEKILSNRQLQPPALLRESFRNIKNKNDDASIMFDVYHQIDTDGTDNNPLSSLVGHMSLKSSVSDDLFQLVTSLSDFQDLFRKHYLVSSFEYVHRDRLDELQRIKNVDFDLSKLVRLCEELNSNFQNENYLSVAMLVRSILDHIPPILGYNTFLEVSNNYGGKSLKKSLQNLQNSSRNIADAHLHGAIRNKESLPNDAQIDFRNDLDVLLGEIVRVLK